MGRVTVTSRHSAIIVARRTSGASDPVLLGRRIRQAKKRGEFAFFCSSHRIHTRKAYDLIAIADAVDFGLSSGKRGSGDRLVQGAAHR